MTVGLTTCPFMAASYKTKIGYQVKKLQLSAFGNELLKFICEGVNHKKLLLTLMPAVVNSSVMSD